MSNLGFQPTAYRVIVLGGRYEIEHSYHSNQWDVYFWRSGRGGDGDYIRLPNGEDFDTLEDATQACEAHAAERMKLRSGASHG